MFFSKKKKLTFQKDNCKYQHVMPSSSFFKKSDKEHVNNKDVEKREEQRVDLISPSLMDKLLQAEIDREATIIFDCLVHIARNHFYFDV